MAGQKPTEPCQWCGKVHDGDDTPTIGGWYQNGIKVGEVTNTETGKTNIYIAVRVGDVKHAIGPIVDHPDDGKILCLHEDAAKSLLVGLLKVLAIVWRDPVCEALDALLTMLAKADPDAVEIISGTINFDRPPPRKTKDTLH